MGPSPLIPLDIALAGVAALGIDTAPLIYYVERHPTYFNLVREIFQRIDQGAVIGYSSLITLTEVLTKPRQAGDTTVERIYRDLLLNSRHFILLPIDVAIAESAADLRARYHLRTPDALQIAAALRAGCEAFVTNDATLRRVADLRVLVLDQLTL